MSEKNGDMFTGCGRIQDVLHASTVRRTFFDLTITKKEGI